MTVQIGVILIALVLGIIAGVYATKNKSNNNNNFKNNDKGSGHTKSNKDNFDQDLQNLAYMDDLLSNRKKNQKNKSNSTSSSDKCPFCNNPYYECTCSHSSENREKISQSFWDND